MEQAVATIEALSPAGLELVEEPDARAEGDARGARARGGAGRDRRDRRPSTARSSAGVADAVCLKISRCGGIAGLLAAATLVRATGAEVYLASTLDGPLGDRGRAARRRRAGSRGPLPHCGLATLELFEDLENPLPPHAGTIDAAEPPGLAWSPSEPGGERPGTRRPRALPRSPRAVAGRERTTAG